MQITEKDKKIYSFIEKNGFVTVKQIGNIFFSDSTFKGQQAYKRLKALIEYGYIKQYKSVNCTQNIFTHDDKLKRQTYHNILIMDVICKFQECKSIEVLDFKREKTWYGGKVISDAFITVKYKKDNQIILQSFIVEVHASNNKWQKTLEKYNDQDVHNSIIKETPGGLSPILIFVDSVNHNFANATCPYQVVQIDNNMTDFPLIFNTI